MFVDPHQARKPFMDAPNLPVYLYDTHEEAERAIRSLADAGFNLRSLSLVGKGCHTEEQAMGFYTAGDRIKAWGGRGAFWGGLWGLLLSPGVFIVPGIGLLALAGPIVAALVSALEGAVVVGSISALGAAMMQIGVPRDQAIRYETALKVDKYVLLIHGTAAEAAQARAVLSQSTADAL
jgi:hypothetical protein